MSQSLVPHNSIYPPLPNEGQYVRLLTIHPGFKDSDIKCTLNSASLENNPVYEALSYTWDKDGTSRTILLNGIATEVYENLWHILNHVRLDAEKRTIWIDALSIRQDDIEEKSQQVRMIHLTFRQALQVVVWLGPLVDDCEFLFSELKCAAEGGESYLPGDKVTRMSDAYQALLTRRYWDRTWIVQEIYLAKKLQFMCGHATIPGSVFALGLYAARGASVPLWSGSYAGSVIEYIHPEGSRSRTLRNIFDVFDRHGSSQCFDERDRIFALQNMLRTDADEGRIPADFPIVEADYSLLREELLFAVLKAWEMILNLSFANKALTSLALTWREVEQYLSHLSSAMLIPLHRTIRCSPVSQINQVWRGDESTGYCVFDVSWNNTDIQYVSRYRVNPLQQIVRFDGPASDVAIIFETNPGGESRAMFGAVSLNTGYMQPAQFTRYKANLLDKKLFENTVAYPRQGHGEDSRIRLSPSQISHLGLLDHRYKDQLTDHEQSHILSIKWEEVGGDGDLLSSERRVIPVLHLENSQVHQLRVKETAPEEFMDKLQEGRRSKISRALARGRRWGNMSRGT